MRAKRTKSGFRKRVVKRTKKRKEKREQKERNELGQFKEGNKAAFKPINWKTVNGLIGIGATMEEIGHVLEVSPETIRVRCLEEQKEPFLDYYKKHNSGFKLRLRRLQIHSAEGEKSVREVVKKNADGTIVKWEEEYYLRLPSIPIQIWLGKNFLGQADKMESRLVEDLIPEEEVVWRVTRRRDIEPEPSSSTNIEDAIHEEE